MPTSTINKPIVLANFYLDTGTEHYSGKSITFKTVDYVRRIITAGNVERSIPLPSGLLQVPDAQITVADMDGQLKTWFDTTTPLRRLVEIIPELESHSGDSTPNYPIFKGEILGFTCPPGEVTVHLRSITSSWLSRPIQHLINRDNFPNMPDDISTAFAPIIFGRVYSYSTTNVEAQGAIQCTLVDTVNHDYVVARHACYSIPAVYRKKPLDSRFTLVSSGEYSTPVVDYTIGGVTYHMQMIRFTAQQYDGTVIQCDVSGSYSKYDWTGTAQVDSVEVRNPSDCLWNLIYLQLKNEVNISKFDADSFIEVRDRCATRNYYCDGAITGKANSLDVITAGAAISNLCGCFNIDFLQTTTSLIKIKLFDLTIDGGSAVPITSELVMKNTFTPSSPETIINHVRYRYFRDNAGLPDGVKAKGNKEYAYEYSIRNTHDQTELSATGSNPNLETSIDQPFIRDDNTAIDVIKKKMPYMALKSYDVEFTSPAYTGTSFIGLSIDLGQAVNLTSIWGMGSGGFTDVLARIKHVAVNLKTWEVDYKATVYWPTSDGDLSIEFTSHASHSAQTRKPQFPLTVNGSTSVTAPKGADMASTPAAPSGHVNVIWQEDDTVEPRKISGHVPIGTGAVLYSGTLESPDTRPTGLGSGDANKVMFYSTDFDHLYMWSGSAWVCMDYSAGNVFYRLSAPTSNGWQLCDGSGTVTVSTPSGGVTTVTIPNLTGGAYVKGGTSYSGPTPTAYVPTVSAQGQMADASPFSGNVGNFTVAGSATLTGDTDENSVGHTHDAPGTGYSVSIVDVPVTAGSGSTSAMSTSPTLTANGTSLDESNTHTHGTSAMMIDISGITVESNAPHYHVLDAAIEPKNMTLLPYLRR